MRSRVVSSLFTALLLVCVSGCAVSSSRFYSDRSSFGSVSLCRTHKAALQRGEYQLARDVEAELGNRLQVKVYQCDKIISDSNKAIAVGVLAAAVVVAAATAEGGGSSGTAANTATSSSDYDWDWDQFYSQYGTLTWRCRGIQTGQFAEDYKCAGDAKTDARWPSKLAESQ